MSKEECDKVFSSPQWRNELERLTKVSDSQLMKTKYAACRVHEKIVFAFCAIDCMFTRDPSAKVARVRKQVIRVKKLPPPHSNYLDVFLSLEPSLKLLCLAKLQRTNSSSISNCRRSKSAILFSPNINYKYKFIVAVTRQPLKIL